MRRVGRHGTILRCEGTVTVVNTSINPEYYGGMVFPTGRPVTVPRYLGDQLLTMPHMSLYGAAPSESDVVAEIRHCFWPEPSVDEACRQFTARALPVPEASIGTTDRPLSILWVIHALHPVYGGIRVIGRLMHYLRRRGHNVAYYAVNQAHEQAIEEWYTNARHRPFRPDIVIGTYYETMFVAAHMKGQKVGFIQGDEPAWPTAPNPEHARQAFSLPGWSYITVAPHLAEKCSREYGTNVVGTLQGNGVDCLDYSPRVNDFNVRRRVFTVVRDVWWKGWPVVEQVFAAMKAMGVTTTACGFHPFHSPVIDLYVQSPSLDAMASLYSRADCYLLASQFEGSPLTPLEAMACGCIPVVTPIGADYIEDGRNGFLVSDAGEMIARAKSVLDNPQLRWTMAQEGLRTARSRTWDMVGQEFEAALVKVM